MEDLIGVSLEGHSAEKTVPHLMQALELLPITTINSIVSDSASACKLSRELIIGNTSYKRVVHTGASLIH